METKPASVCPFRMMAGLVLSAQKASIHVAGRSEAARVEMDLGCIGQNCMMFVKTAEGAQGQAIGGCGVAVAPPLIHLLNNKIDTMIVATVEGVEESLEKVGPMHNNTNTLLYAIARAFRRFIGKPAPKPTGKPNLSTVKE
jgi:hypothetical protein